MLGFEDFGYGTLPDYNGWADGGAFGAGWGDGGSYYSGSGGGGTIGGPTGGPDGIMTGIGDFFGGLLGGSGTPTISLPGAGSGGADVKAILTGIANQAETALQSNLAQFQTGALGADTARARAWEILNSMVSAMWRYGSQGQLSAAERDRRIDPARLKWDWVGYYIDPITGGAAANPGLPGNVTGGAGGGLIGGGGASQAGLGLAGIPDWALIGAVLVFLLLLKDRR